MLCKCIKLGFKHKKPPGSGFLFYENLEAVTHFQAISNCVIVFKATYIWICYSQSISIAQPEILHAACNEIVWSRTESQPTETLPAHFALNLRPTPAVADH